MSEPSPNSRPILFTEIEQFGGAERAALALYRWLSERGLESHIVAYEDRCNLATYAAFPIEIVQLHPGAGPFAKVNALRKYFAARSSSAPQPLLSGYQPAMHATLAGMRGFHDLMHDTAALFDDPSAHGVKHHARRFVSNQIVGYGLRSGGQTIVTSEFLRGECWHDFRVKADIVRMGGFSRPLSTPHSAEKGKLLRMLSVCRLESNKRLDWLLHALATLEQNAEAPLSQRTDWRFDLVGKGPQYEQLRTLAQQLGIADRIHLRGFVSDAELEQLYAQANLFLMPAIQGYGIPAIESLDRGIPVLLHRDSGVSDILLNTPWAVVFEGGKENTAAALAKSIEGVLKGQHITAALPDLPTEDAWAERVARLCNWVPSGFP